MCGFKKNPCIKFCFSFILNYEVVQIFLLMGGKFIITDPRDQVEQHLYWELYFCFLIPSKDFFNVQVSIILFANYSPTGQREFLLCGTNIRVLLVGCPLTGTTIVDTEGAVDDVLFLPIATASKYWRSLNAACFLASLFVARIVISNNDGICKWKISGLKSLRN